MIKPYYLFVLAIFILSCKSQSKLLKVSQDEIEFSLAKGPCFGTCPVYSLQIYGGGKAIFNGERNTEKLGKFSKQLGDIEYKALKEKAAGLSIRLYKEEYPSNIADLPTITVGLRDDKGLMLIRGKEDRPEDITKFQTILEQVAESEGWNELEGNSQELEKKKKEQYIITEIIIEPGQGTLLPPFFNRLKSAYGVSIKSQISPSQNLWLVTYDQNKIDGESLLKALNEDPDVSSAEFNKRINSRGGN